MIRKIGLVVALATTVTLGACNTVNGAGKDLKSAGSAIEGASGQGNK
ncbi:hypothetical protein DMC47_13480 [Nostoc sp. 3335mG]|nr:hypothetical protein DMC47_13480 [Nostoc sp. 3335mG]